MNKEKSDFLLMLGRFAVRNIENGTMSIPLAIFTETNKRVIKACHIGSNNIIGKLRFISRFC